MSFEFLVANIWSSLVDFVNGISRKLWVCGTVLRFFYWKNGPINGGFMVKNGNNGTVFDFFVLAACQ